MRNTILGRLRFLAAISCFLAAGGCWSSDRNRDQPAGAAPQTQDLTLVVVDDPPLAEAIERLRAEWKAQSGATLTVQRISAAELESAQSPPAGADAIIYPSGLLGFLAERGWIVPLPADYASNSELAWFDTFELQQVAETRWASTPHAVPLGTVVPTLYYRADLFEQFHKLPPRTWPEYHALVEFFANRENLPGIVLPEGWHAAAEPLSPGWAGRMLLARGAAYARHRDHYSTLFKIDTMQPLVDGAAFVRALEELAADARLGPSGALELDPAAARREFLEGRAAMALTFPGHLAPDDEHAGQPPPPTGFAELPGATSVYNYASGSWETRKSDESPHVTLLGFSGRLGSIAAGSAEAASAFQLLAWLAGRQWGTMVAAASAATTLYRRSQMRNPRPWVDPLTDQQAARQYAETVRDALVRQTYLIALRIPGEARYLAALDAAVAGAVSGEKSASEALAAAADAWAKITAELGLERQRAAYRKSLGLEP